VVNFNSIMVDGTGMCGACRVELRGETRFACVDGPEFDAHQVSWDLLLARQSMYLEQEKRAVEVWQGQAR
jgi:ferredoxin--NADP+ reductase